VVQGLTIALNTSSLYTNMEESKLAARDLEEVSHPRTKQAALSKAVIADRTVRFLEETRKSAHLTFSQADVNKGG
jgi:hypothetical protein